MELRDQLQAHLGDAFTLERELGGGGMSRVFVATEVRLSRRVAIKVLSPELVEGLNAERFEREILLAASLQQANIVGVLAAGDLDGLPYFTMPFVEGESLRVRLTGRGLPIVDVLAILRDVTKALAYAHARGIVHRDIKPDNVLLSGGTAMVTDFGIAKAISASRGDGGGTLTSVGTSIGTPAYMAPEQVAGDPNLDHRVDLYSLGCLAYELLTGASPFADRTPPKMLAAHLSEKPTDLAKLRTESPPALNRLVAQLLEKDPVDRPATANDVLQALDAVSTTSSPTLTLSAPGQLPKILGIYAAATLAVAILAKAAVVGIGLPDWVLSGAVVVMLLGLPALLVTAYVKRVARQAAMATPTLTPGGTMQAKQLSGTVQQMALKAHPHLSWRRTARAGMVAMGFFVVLVGGFMGLRSAGIGPAGSLFASGAMAQEDRVLLADFTTSAEDSALAPIIQAAVRAAMSQSRAVRVLDPTDVAATLTRMQRPTNTPIDAGISREVATRSGAKAILGGRLARAGSGYLISLELTSAEQGTPLASFQGTADGVKDLLEVVDELTRKLRGKMGESLKQVQNSVPLAKATTTSLEALRLFTEATVANDVEADYDKSIRLLRQALALDSTFALAWRKLNASLVNSNGSIAARDSALDNAARYADKLPPLERELVLAATYMSHGTKADRGKALEAYRTAYAMDSSDQISANQLMLLYERRGEPDSALRYARRKVEIRPDGSNKIRVVEMLMTAGRTAEAAAMLDTIQVQHPEFAATTWYRWNKLGVEYQTGDLAAARSSAEQILREGTDADRAVTLPNLVQLDLISGRLKSAAATRARSDSLLAARRSGAIIDGVSEAEHDILFRGRTAEGIARLDRAVAGAQWREAAPVDRPSIQVSALYAQAGAPEKARQVITSVREALPAMASAPANKPWLDIADGEIALAEGKYDIAVQLFRGAMVASDGAPSEARERAGYALARAFDRAGQTDSARVAYQRWLDLPASTRFGAEVEGIGLAAANKRLGELYDAKGDRTNAIKYYTAFVDQWKAADADLQPTVASVKKRLNELQTQEGK